jgi:ribosomal protein S18 acetylase RimI-like enzyme
MQLSRIEFQGDHFKEIEAYLADKIYEFNADATGYFDGEEFAATVRDASGCIIAGVSGHTWGHCCTISQLWVHESARNQGVGKCLLRAAETHAQSNNCIKIVLSSHSFQAPDFYDRLGYVEEARIAGNPRGHFDIHFGKYLVRGIRT